MMRLKETTRARLMTLHGSAMFVLGLGLLYIRAAMTNALSYFFGAFSPCCLSQRLFFSLHSWTGCAPLV